VHGDPDALLRILLGLGLISDEGDWMGGTARLVLIGDLNCRGPDSVAVMHLVMELQAQAAQAGGFVDGCYETLASWVAHLQGVDPEPDESTFWLTSDDGGRALWSRRFRVGGTPPPDEFVELFACGRRSGSG